MCCISLDLYLTVQENLVYVLQKQQSDFRSDTESRLDQELAGEEKRKRERGWKEGQRQKI